MDESEIESLLRSNAPGKWEQIKKAASIAQEHRRRVKGGDLFIFLFPLAAAMAKDAFFDFIPVLGTIFGVFITVYLFIFMWGRGRIWLRFVFFIIAVLDLIPFINLIPFNTASVVYAFLRARKDAAQSQAALSDMERQAPRLKRKLQTQTARMARAVELQEERAGRRAASAEDSVDGEAVPTATSARPTSVRLARAMDNVPVVGPAKMIHEAAAGRRVGGEQMTFRQRAAQGVKGATYLAADATGVGEAARLARASRSAFQAQQYTTAMRAGAGAVQMGQTLHDQAKERSARGESAPNDPGRGISQPMQQRTAPEMNQQQPFATIESRPMDATARIREAGSRLAQLAHRPTGGAGAPLQPASGAIAAVASSSGSSPAPVLPPLPLTPVVSAAAYPEQHGSSAVDPEAFKQESEQYMSKLDTVYGRKPEDIVVLKTIHADTFLPYLEGKRSLRTLIGKKETAPQALAMLRKANISYRYQVDDSSWKERSPDPNSLPEFLSREVTASLDALDNQLRREDLNEEEMRALKNNAFYVVAEALDTASVENRKKIDTWLAKHEEDIKALDTFTSSDGKREDTLALFTKQKIIAKTENEEMARRQLEALFADPLTPESKQRIEEIRTNIVQPILDDRFDPKDQFLVRRQALVAEVEAVSFGLDKKIVEKWRQSKAWLKKDEQGNDVFRESYSSNLWGIRNLEAIRPGSAAVLSKEFGIANFGRYDKKMLLRQLEMKDKDVRYGIVVYPEADWNGAFSENRTQLAQASEQLRNGGIETRIVEAGSQRDLARRLLSLQRKNSASGKKFAYAIVAGHGSENSIVLGQTKAAVSVPPPFPDSLKTDEELVSSYDQWLKSLPNEDKAEFTKEDILGGKGIGRALSGWFEDGAPKVLISCSTGAEDGIAQQISEKSSGQISAPKIPTNVEKIDVIFDKNGKFSFDVKYHGTEAAQYAAGKKIMGEDV